MKSKTLIGKQIEKKNNPNLVETLIFAKKENSWTEVASILSRPKRKKLNLNLGQLNEFVKEKETIVFPGKILSQGEIDKKIKLVAWKFSKKAKEKLLNAGCSVSEILEEIKSNPSAKGIRILKNENY